MTHFIKINGINSNDNSNNTISCSGGYIIDNCFIDKDDRCKKNDQCVIDLCKKDACKESDICFFDIFSCKRKDYF